MSLLCPVKDCTRDRPGETYLMCKPCWRKVPAQMRRDLWRIYAAMGKPKTRGWMERSKKLLGMEEFRRRVSAYLQKRKEVIQVAYLEPAAKEEA